MPKQALKFSPKRKHTIWIGLLLVLALAACSEAAPTVETAAQVAEPTGSPTAASPEPTTAEAAAGEEEMAAEEQVDYCLDCHVDKQQLINTADPEMEVVTESSGQG